MDERDAPGAPHPGRDATPVTTPALVRRRRPRRFVVAVPAVAAVLVLMAMVHAQAVGVANTSRYVGDGQWDWTIYLTAPRDVLPNVRCVEYRLHPTFPNPVQRVCSLGDPGFPFALQGKGWGTFEVAVAVTFKNGEAQHLRHMLAFEARSVEQELPLSAANTAREQRRGWWQWTIFLQGPEEALGQVRCVEYTLHETFPDRVRAICERGRGREAFPLSSSGWGTFTVQIRVILDSGRVQELTHLLRFPH